jgi:hypothetical protein
MYLFSGPAEKRRCAPQSKTLARSPGLPEYRQVLECGAAAPLFFAAR